MVWGLRHGRTVKKVSLVPLGQNSPRYRASSWPKTEPPVPLRVAFASLFFPTHVQPITPTLWQVTLNLAFPWPLRTNCPAPYTPLHPNSNRKVLPERWACRANPLRPLLRCCPQTMPQPGAYHCPPAVSLRPFPSLC